ncbi:MAG: hypothetical protein ACFFB7_07965 [Candidatus Sifarchaeia archaeon]
MEDELAVDSSDVEGARWIERTLAALLVFISLIYFTLGSRDYGIYNLLALPSEVLLAALGLWIWWRSAKGSMSDSNNYPPELLLTCPHCGATYHYGESSVLPERAVVCQNCAITFPIESTFFS